MSVNVTVWDAVQDILLELILPPPLSPDKQEYAKHARSFLNTMPIRRTRP